MMTCIPEHGPGVTGSEYFFLVLESGQWSQNQINADLQGFLPRNRSVNEQAVQRVADPRAHGCFAANGKHDVCYS
jgi:hypothetical protein